MKSLRSCRGVTLIELLMVLLLIVSLMGLATVGFISFFRGKDPQILMKDMASYVRYLQFKTIEEGKIHKLSVDGEEHGLRSYVQDHQKKFSPLLDSLTKRFEGKSSYQFEIENSGEIYFFPDGTVTRSEIRILSDDHKIASLFITNRLGNLKTEFYA